MEKILLHSIVKAALCAAFIFCSHFLFAQGPLWSPSGQTDVTTSRQVFIKNSAIVDSSLTANLIISNALQTLGLAQIDALLVNGTSAFSGNLTLANGVSIIHAVSTGTFSFNNSAGDKIISLGYNLSDPALQQGLSIAPAGYKGNPNGSIAFGDANPNGQILLALGTGSTGSRINVDGDGKKMVFQNDGGDKYTMGGVNAPTLLETTQGINIAPRPGFTFSGTHLLNAQGSVNAESYYLNGNLIDVAKIGSDIAAHDSAINVHDSLISNISPSQWQNDTVNPSNIFYSAGNVGIGVSSPSVPFEVIGRVKISGSIEDNVDSLGNPLPHDSLKPVPPYRSIIIDGGLDQITATSGTIDFVNTNLTTTGSFQSNSITTANLTIIDKIESDTMHARRSFEVNSSLRLSRDTSVMYAEMSTKDTAVALMLQKDAAAPVVIGDAPAPPPGESRAKLTVAGNSQFNGDVKITGGIISNCLTTSCLNVSGQTTFDNINVLNSIKVGTNSLFIGGSPTPGNDNNIYSTNGPLLFQDGTTENTLINPTGGWLGIGTTSPKTNVDIRGHLNIQNGNQAAVVYFPNTGGSSPNLYFRSDDDPSTYEATSERMIIKADGKIGIGTTDPNATLDVDGNIHASAKISASAFTSNSPLPFEAPQGVERMRIDDISGNVGINTMQPSEKLEVKGGNIRVDDAYDLLLRNSHHGLGWYGSTGVTPSKLFANADIDGPVIYGYSGGALGAKNNSENIALRWDGSGNVGIGIYGVNGNGNGPHAKLEVRGEGGETVRISNNAPYNSGFLTFENNSGVRAWLGTSAVGSLFSSNAVGGALAIRGTDGVQIGVTSTAVITVLSDAVGIGTTSPSFPLDVCGTIRAKEVNVDINAGCDFVFESSYPLLALKKRKEIVLLNHHLLNVPPAKEMEKEGLDLEKTTLGILQNVEEHELYFYEHDERIEVVENENKELKKSLLEQKKIMEIQQMQIEELKKAINEIKK